MYLFNSAIFGKLRLIRSLGFLLLFFAACSKDEPVEVNMGYRYFPANPGHWTIYQVDSVAWNDFDGSVDTFNFQLKEIIESEFIDEQSRTNIRIERYKRASDTSEWVIKDVWFGLRTPSTAERVEENKRYVKMIFPVEEDDEWDGNAFNMLGQQTYTYTNVHEPYQINLFSFDSSATVMQQDYTTQISKNYEEEVFVTGIGLVYKKYINQKKLPTGVITKGCDYSYKLIAWGD